MVAEAERGGGAVAARGAQARRLPPPATARPRSRAGSRPRLWLPHKRGSLLPAPGLAAARSFGFPVSESRSGFGVPFPVPETHVANWQHFLARVKSCEYVRK